MWPRKYSRAMPQQGFSRSDYPGQLPRTGIIWVWPVARVHMWACGPTTARASVSVHGTCHHQESYGYLGSGSLSWTMSGPEGHPAARVMPAQVACPITQGHGVMVPSQSGSVMISMAQVTTKGHTDVQILSSTVAMVATKGCTVVGTMTMLPPVIMVLTSRAPARDYV